jgi:hypothetical protein
MFLNGEKGGRASFAHDFLPQDFAVGLNNDRWTAFGSMINSRILTLTVYSGLQLVKVVFLGGFKGGADPRSVSF